jgi:antagonist of KipI
MILVLRPGLQTSVQDQGRFGYRHLGVGQSGAADAGALRLANLLLGNPPDAAALEITLLGPTLAFGAAAHAAITGSDPQARLDGKPLCCGQPFEVPSGSRLELGRCQRGARCYLTFSGGLEIPPLLGSASTDIGAGFGGIGGRALQRGDQLALRTPASAPRTPAAERWWAGVPEDPGRTRLPEDVLRVVLDPQTALGADLPALSWRVDARSSRKALRLCGPALDLRDQGAQRVSAPVAPGDVQVLPDGEPLLLGVEAQTVGGYPLLGRIIRADRDRLGQLRPGDAVRLLPVDLSRADAAWQAREAAWYRLQLALQRTVRPNRPRPRGIG